MRVEGCGLKVLGVGCRVQGSGFGVYSTRTRAPPSAGPGAWYRVCSLGLGPRAEGFRAEGSAIWDQGSGFRVSGFGSRG